MLGIEASVVTCARSGDEFFCFILFQEAIFCTFCGGTSMSQ